jgi:hypothetical protein
VADTVVFLDIDGVLNDAAWLAALEAAETRDANAPRVLSWSRELAVKMLDPSRVARLQRLCDATGASVVIVSGWRRWAKPEEIAAVLATAGLRAPVLGAVGGLKMGGDLRASAAVEWLDGHPEVKRWVVLDDTTRYWDDMRVRGGLWRDYHIAPVNGLTDDDVERAIAVLAIPGPEKAPKKVPSAPPSDREVIQRLAVILNYAGSERAVDITLRAYRGPGERTTRKRDRQAVLAINGKSFYDPNKRFRHSFLMADGATDAEAVSDLREFLTQRAKNLIDEAARDAATADQAAQAAQDLAVKHRIFAAKLGAQLDTALTAPTALTVLGTSAVEASRG